MRVGWDCSVIILKSNIQEILFKRILSEGLLQFGILSYGILSLEHFVLKEKFCSLEFYPRRFCLGGRNFPGGFRPVDMMSYRGFRLWDIALGGFCPGFCPWGFYFILGDFVQDFVHGGSILSLGILSMRVLSLEIMLRAILS